MHDLPRQLSADELAALFERRTRIVECLATTANPLAQARRLLRSLPEAEVIEALNAHPRVGERTGSATSAQEQDVMPDEDPLVLSELARLNRDYEEKFGFRFVVFVNRRSRREVLEVLRARLVRGREQEFQTAIDDLVAIAEDRYRLSLTREKPA